MATVLSKQSQGALIGLNDVCVQADRLSRSSVQRLREELPEEHPLQPVIDAFFLFKSALVEWDAEREAPNA